MIRLAALLIMMSTALWAVEPEEMLADPVLEQRARDLSSGLRCPVCRNESIDLSNAALAKELRIVLRERLVAGDSDDEIIAYMVQRYGEFVLLRPDITGVNWVLWFAPAGMFLLALGVGWSAIRRRPVAAEDGLTPSEQARIDKIMQD